VLCDLLDASTSAAPHRRDLDALFRAVEVLDRHASIVARGGGLDHKVFVLAADSSGGKTAAANCGRCREDRDGHDRESCACLLCHGFLRRDRRPRPPHRHAA
jgi:hypothetical protein